MACNLTVMSKEKDFSRSQEVIYTIKVVISQKRCRITLLLHYTNKK